MSVQTVFKWLLLATVSLVTVYCYFIYSNVFTFTDVTASRDQTGRNRTVSEHRTMSKRDVIDIPKQQAQTAGGSSVHIDRGAAPGFGVHAIGGGECARTFLGFYQRHCGVHLIPDPSNVLERFKTGSKQLGTVLCPCVSKYLLGSASLSHDLRHSTSITNHVDPLNVTSLNTTGAGREPGGRWYPTWCQARQRVAIVVAYRNRPDDLRRLVTVLPSVLKRQLIDFTIFVIEQINPFMFNRASLLNVGFVEAKKVGHFDCFFLHDVDMLPKDDRNMYTCSHLPRHVGKYRDHRSFSYKKYFGGIVAIRTSDFERVNGLSNRYYGWGGEDDDFRLRLTAKGLKVAPRFPMCIAQYSTTSHKHDTGNSVSANKSSGRWYRPKTYSREGLNSLQYTVVQYRHLAYYTHISVDLPSQ